MKINPSDVHIFIQARLSSTRLPKKVLMSINELPIIEICCKRISSSFPNVTVLTSNDSSDDQLVSFLNNKGISVRRGSLENVLSRFYEAAEGVGDNGVIIRLTADNIFPDHIFLRDVIDFYEEHHCEYLTTTAPTSNLPYGLSAEVFKKNNLTSAFEGSTSESEREHVTPWMIKNLKKTVFKTSKIEEDLSMYRCTIDTAEDYEHVCNLVRDIDIIKTSSYELCKRLKDKS